MNRYQMKTRLLVTLLGACLLAAESVAQTAPAREISLTVGRGELLQFDSDVKTVAASEPKIADVIAISPREVMVNAKGIGKATIIVWEIGSIPRRYNVTVNADKEDFENVRRLVRDHFRYTASQNALTILNDWATSKAHFVKVMPRDYKAVLLERKKKAALAMA